MTNRASEGELKAIIERYVDRTAVLAEQDCRNFNNKHLLKLDMRTAIEDLIRTEKLKLLAEVREQTTIFKIKAHDKKGQPHLYEAGRGVPTDVLTKLEAEL